MSKVHSIFGLIFITGIFFSQCTPPVITHVCPQPFWNTYSSFDSNGIKKEITRLEEMLAGKKKTTPISGIDTTNTTDTQQISELEIVQRLFELSIHHANREYDMDKISQYASSLYQCGGPDSLRYLNWSRPARVLKGLVLERDSLVAAISGISEIAGDSDEKKIQLIKKLKVEKNVYLKQYDSLSAVITSQQETILKLQKLDVLMEKRRNKIQ